MTMYAHYAVRSWTSPTKTSCHADVDTRCACGAGTILKTISMAYALPVARRIQTTPTHFRLWIVKRSSSRHVRSARRRRRRSTKCYTGTKTHTLLRALEPQGQHPVHHLSRRRVSEWCLCQWGKAIRGNYGATMTTYGRIGFQTERTCKIFVWCSATWFMLSAYRRRLLLKRPCAVGNTSDNLGKLSRSWLIATTAGGVAILEMPRHPCPHLLTSLLLIRRTRKPASRRLTGSGWTVGTCEHHSGPPSIATLFFVTSPAPIQTVSTCTSLARKRIHSQKSRYSLARIPSSRTPQRSAPRMLWCVSLETADHRARVGG
mmetsp:Transcript_5262/g.6474  ORF Transcript_5262/g.6474 Transcript_5262/m.6474 type:complete len:317 (+) Transcript_5262:108-1058(+)